MPMWNGWGFGVLFMAAFWILLIAGIVLVVRWAMNQKRALPSGRDGDGALEILRQRYARGEIDKEEFERKKRDLT